MTFTVTARNARTLSQQIDRFTASLPAGTAFPMNFDRSTNGTWWASMSGQHVETNLTFSALVALTQKWMDSTLEGIATNA